jgi:hypothetical protein
VAAGYVIGILVPGIVEMNKLLEALDISIMEERLLKVRPGSFSRRTLRWH